MFGRGFAWSFVACLHVAPDTNRRAHLFADPEYHDCRSGWYDVTVLPVDRQVRLSFKEGDVAVLSTPRPGSGTPS